MINLIVAVVAGIIIFGVAMTMRGKRPTEIIQATVVLLGILGTFVGIIISLFFLDFNNVNESIPNLLSGIWVAFLTSALGTAISIFIFLYPNYWKQKEDIEEIEEADTEIQILRELKLLNKNIVGNEETSLSVQLLKMQTNITDNQRELKKSFDEFAKKMAENNMEALEKVIKDFNNKLQEQFGDNFKKLNEAVFNMIKWQEEYKETVEKNSSELEKIQTVLEASRESMGDSAKVLGDIAVHVNTFKENADALKEQLEGTRQTISSIKNFSTDLNGKADEIVKDMKRVTGDAVEELGRNLLTVSNALVEDYKEIHNLIKKTKEGNS